MWLCTQHGFYSIVQKSPGEFHVRARLRRDLENLARLCGTDWDIRRSPANDYHFRIVCDQATVTAILAALAECIDYSNFKSRIHELADQDGKPAAYGDLWSGLHRLQAD